MKIVKSILVLGVLIALFVPHIAMAGTRFHFSLNFDSLSHLFSKSSVHEYRMNPPRPMMQPVPPPVYLPPAPPRVNQKIIVKKHYGPNGEYTQTTTIHAYPSMPYPIM